MEFFTAKSPAPRTVMGAQQVLNTNLLRVRESEQEKERVEWEFVLQSLQT